MDASEVITKKKTQTIYIDQLNKFVAANPGGDCGKLSTCAGVSSCNYKFESFENKYDFFAGKNACTDCKCPVDGGSK